MLFGEMSSKLKLEVFEIFSTDKLAFLLDGLKRIGVKFGRRDSRYFIEVSSYSILLLCEMLSMY